MKREKAKQALKDQTILNKYREILGDVRQGAQPSYAPIAGSGVAFNVLFDTCRSRNYPKDMCYYGL